MHLEGGDKGFFCSFVELFLLAFSPCRGVVSGDSLCRLASFEKEMHFEREDEGFLCSFVETFASSFAPCRGEVLADSLCRSRILFFQSFLCLEFFFARVFT